MFKTDSFDNQNSLVGWDNPVEEDFIVDDFSKNEVSLTSLTVKIENDSESSKDKVSDINSQVSYIEKCMPNWKQNFPWVCWSSEDRVLYCLHCRELLRRYFPDKLQKSNVFYINASEGIFAVAKTLRKHHDCFSHVAAIYLFSCGTLMSFISLFNEYFKAMRTEDDVMEIARSMFDYSDIQKEGLIKTINGIGKCIEDKLICSVKKSKFYSIVADQCRGIIILRWVNERNMAVEHVLWSYHSTVSLTPLQYLEKFDLDNSKLSLYIANTLCQHCQRCENIKVEPASLPPRPPSTLSFVNILWRLDFLRPIHSLIKTIYGLYKKYPYKFAKTMEISDFKALALFDVTPISAIKVMDRFDSIKAVALDIYSKESITEALGVAMVNLKNDDQHKKILMLLQEIIDTAKGFAILLKVSESQIVKLNQAFGSLKSNSAGACFVLHSANGDTKNRSSSEMIFEFLNFVEKFIDENQKSIYYNGKVTAHEFLKLFRLKKLVDSQTKIVNTKVTFPIFSNVVKVYLNNVNLNVEERTTLLRNFSDFYNFLLSKMKDVNSCIDVLRYIYDEKNFSDTYPLLHNFFLYCASMPFLNCHIPRSLFVSFIAEQRVETSIWARMDPLLKSNLLYLQHDMHIIGSTELLSWWLNLMP